MLAIERKIRAYTPWPGCYTFLPQRFRRKGNTGRVVVLKAEIVRDMPAQWREAPPGTVLECVRTFQKATQNAPARRPGIAVKCADTALMLTVLKPEGGQQMDAGAFLAGRRLVPGEDSLG